MAGEFSAEAFLERWQKQTLASIGEQVPAVLRMLPAAAEQIVWTLSISPADEIEKLCLEFTHKATLASGAASPDDKKLLIDCLSSIIEITSRDGTDN